MATEEKPKELSGLKFYMDANEARDATLHGPGYVYQFEVDDKCDTQSFDMDTIMLFRKDKTTGELSFFASGTWLDLHEIVNIPFYYDFESRSSVFVEMSLKYFNEHYKITSKAVQVKPELVKKQVTDGMLKIQNEVKPQPQQSQPEQGLVQPQATSQKTFSWFKSDVDTKPENTSDAQIDTDVINELFGT